MTNVPGFVNRLAAWSLLAGLVFALYAVMVRPLVNLHEDLDTAQARTADLITRFSRISDRAGDFQAALQDLQRREASSGLYLTGTTEPVAAAALQTRLSAEIRKNGGEIRTLQALPATEDGGFKRIVVSVRFTTVIASFPQILHALESAEPLLFVDNIEITTRPVAPRGGVIAPEPPLLVRIDLSGYLRPEA